MIRYINYLIITLKLFAKSLREYKVNFWSSILTEGTFIPLNLFFFFIFFINFENVVEWGKEEYILFFFLGNIAFLISGLFIWTRGVHYNITTGLLSNYLVRPINHFYQYSISNFAFPVFPSLIINFALFFPLLIFFEIHLINIFYGIILLILIIILNVSFFVFIESLNFIKLGFGEILRRPLEDMSFTFRQYPFKLFENIESKFLLFLFGNIFVSSLLIPLITNKEIWNLNYQLIVLFSLISIFILGTYFNWARGLKKYEAFG